MNKLRFVVMILVLCAVAAAGPIPFSALGTNVDVLVTTSGSARFPVGTGGAFGNWVGSAANPTTFWCVDSQQYITDTNGYKANVVLLSNLPSSLVRYGNNPTWTRNDGALSGVTSSVARYAMAAWLIDQYTPDTNEEQPDDSPGNLEIQQAIWTIMHNTDGPHDATGFSGSSTASGSWIDQAKTAFSNGLVDLNRWAAVSGVVTDANGKLSLTDTQQTFLVRVVPEPGFYGVLALGLSGVFLALRRRKA